MEILKVENLDKSYGKGEAKVDALKNINLSINKGEFVAIVGPSGSGKSTLLHLIGGVDKPTKGKVYINNVDIYSLKEKDLSIFRRRNVGLIYQFYNLIPVLSAKENILLPAELDNRKIDKEYLDDLDSIYPGYDKNFKYKICFYKGQIYSLDSIFKKFKDKNYYIILGSKDYIIKDGDRIVARVVYKSNGVYSLKE